MEGCFFFRSPCGLINQLSVAAPPPASVHDCDTMTLRRSLKVRVTLASPAGEMCLGLKEPRDAAVTAC